MAERSTAACEKPAAGSSGYAAIPHRIHQTWKTNSVPERWRDYHVSWRRHNPSWELVLWTDADNRRLVEQHYPWFLATYDSFDRDIQRVDAAKYLILSKYGGVYADLDCECLKPIDELIEPGGAVFARTADGVIECAFFASSPGHPIWQQVLYQLQHPSLMARLLHNLPATLGRCGFDAAHVLFHTGPQMMRRVVRRYLRVATADAPALTVYPAQLLSNRSWWDRFTDQGPATGFVEHHYSNSWLEPDEARFVDRFTRGLLTGLLVSGCLFLLAALAFWLPS